jgi:hypothetical protein
MGESETIVMCENSLGAARCQALAGGLRQLRAYGLASSAHARPVPAIRSR